MYLVKQGGKLDYYYKEYFIDSEDELVSIDVNSCCPGSIAYVISNQKVFILNSKRE